MPGIGQGHDARTVKFQQNRLRAPAGPLSKPGWSHAGTLKGYPAGRHRFGAARFWWGRRRAAVTALRIAASLLLDGCTPLPARCIGSPGVANLAPPEGQQAPVYPSLRGERQLSQPGTTSWMAVCPVTDVTFCGKKIEAVGNSGGKSIFAASGVRRSRGPIALLPTCPPMDGLRSSRSTEN